MLRAALLALLLVASGPLSVRGDDAPPAVELSPRLEHETFGLVNGYRTQHGLPPLVWNPDIAALARAHSRDMATGAVGFGHEGFRARMDHLKAIFPGLHGGGENVFMSDERKGLAELAVQSWLNSPPHLHNIRGDYDASGLGMWQGSDGAWYFTQIFVQSHGR